MATPLTHKHCPVQQNQNNVPYSMLCNVPHSSETQGSFCLLLFDELPTALTQCFITFDLNRSHSLTDDQF